METTFILISKEGIIWEQRVFPEIESVYWIKRFREQGYKLRPCPKAKPVQEHLNGRVKFAGK